MSGHKSFSALRDRMRPEQRVQVEQKVEQMRHEMALHELREARRLTQAALGETLHVDQSAVAKMERRTDMYVSNLRRFVQAMGGELHVVARFPEGDVEITNFAAAGELPPPN